MPDPSVLTVSRLFTAALLTAGLCSAVPLNAPTTADLGRVLAARQQIQRFGPQVWPGWSAAAVLLRAGAADTLLGWPGAPPTEFQRVASLSFDHLPVYRRADHLVPVPAATAWPLGHTWVLALPTLPEFQQAVDAALGHNVVTLDDPSYVRAAVHEGFHAYQFSVLKGHLPAFGAADEAAVLARLGASPPLTGQLTLEAQALSRALGAPTQLEAREAGQTFLRLRAGRRARQPADVPAVERQLEWTEGLARYAEVGVARRAGQGSADPWKAFLDDLDQPARIRSGVRDLYALLGAAQGFVLDRLTPGWKVQALPGGTALETLLDRGVHQDRVPPALQGARLTTLTLAAHRLRAAVAATPAVWRQGLRGVSDLGTLDGLLFEFPQPGRGRFSGEGAGLALDVAFFADDGHLLLRVRVPPCAAAPCPTSGPEQPFRWALEAPANSLDWVPAGARLQAAPEQALTPDPFRSTEENP